MGAAIARLALELVDLLEDLDGDDDRVVVEVQEGVGSWRSTLVSRMYVFGPLGVIVRVLCVARGRCAGAGRRRDGCAGTK
jgi:hypothetical protein